MARNLLRFKDLKSRNIAQSRQQLTKMVEEYGFPAGFRMPGMIIRCWFEDEVYSWLESAPSALISKPPAKGALRMRLAGEYVRPRRSKAEVSREAS